MEGLAVGTVTVPSLLIKGRWSIYFMGTADEIQENVVGAFSLFYVWQNIKKELDGNEAGEENF